MIFLNIFFTHFIYFIFTVITSLKVPNFLISVYDSSCNYFSLNYFLSTIDGIPSCLGDGP